ncbi:sugar-binding transcriptional regulator [Kineococcus terrestris]|uniref:sugar-binding transcriptional regulator n=1 Tax=Kineococcus terrestris TaxID=2044856 RepID=UPI0034DAC911
MATTPTGDPARPGSAGSAGVTGARFPAALMHTAATLYYLQDATQAEIAARLGTSRATVSRLLREARERGIVRIEVAPLDEHDPTGLAARLEDALGLERVVLSAAAAPDHVAEAVSPALAQVLAGVGLGRDDVLLVSSGRTLHEVAQRDLPPMPGVLVVPMVGGQDEPEAWYATNEITRRVAATVGGVPRFLFAPALPSAELRAGLLADPSTQRVLDLWARARCAVMGVGAPPARRASIPGFVPVGEEGVRRAVGDVVSRFYDAEGREVAWEGAERLMAVPLDVLHAVPVRIAVAHGSVKVPSIVAGARGRHFTHLVTDPATAAELAAELGVRPDRPGGTP